VSRRRLTRFVDPRGNWRELREPDGEPTGAQLRKLNRLGMLDLTPHRHQFEPITKGEAAHAIDDAVARDPVERMR